MHGLPQSGIIAKYYLRNNLAPHVYHQCIQKTGLWNHKFRPVTFSLVVDDFGVKYIGKQHAYHLIESIRKVKIGTIACNVASN